MASIHVEISGSSSRFSGMLRALIDSTRSVSNQSLQVLAICDAYINKAANPDLNADATYADLAIALGLTGANANKDAHTIYTLLNSANGRLTGGQISAFVDQLG